VISEMVTHLERQDLLDREDGSGRPAADADLADRRAMA
jgi:hypothetical protein